ncbi:GreA/GreB family elongation factor [Nonlabens xiamenensis]|uniref:GreA/GreB family elongation factor n=1 Tax=Nonlabens xiamenensis TaxID=2341043 RepID=UPI000F6137A6|nr:GreA/GreB family elongation factor [Nonlabens xiamenensis]
MSRGFVKEGDQEEPVIIPQRAVLPDQVINYVTPQGYQALKEELDQLEHDFSHIVETNETERRRVQTLISGKIQLLKERLASARPIDLQEQPQGEVRFGARVSLYNAAIKSKQVFTITGVDEANVNEGKIAFTTPIAKALMGAKVGETVEFKLGNEVRLLRVDEIDYTYVKD